MKTILFQIKQFILLFILQRYCRIILPFSLEEVKQRLIDISEILITNDRLILPTALEGVKIYDKINVNKKVGSLGADPLYYILKTSDNNYFIIDGPVRYKRIRLLILGRIISNINTKNRVILEIYIRLANTTVWIFYICLFLIFNLILSLIFSRLYPAWVIMSTQLIIVFTPMYVMSMFGFLFESTQIVNLLKHKNKHIY
jgi:hypothetical protein